ncbi:1,4-dihydroxy-2-naphthoate polyprenyltransferase [Pseudonocardia sp. Ae406_Ps2]|uniref:1,4-dihydroxy-2-naphthoate polyprenyltransferase n=1 Tax=unclassified Pseudonocardia TaxID=2619320 RepID=UPI00094B2EFA|nr:MULTISPECIES: 1,4-dihydroxy-2-naphthoate polyprenyltransferase [unclassified Pseudonocardia]OLL97791.1 1,4-dihydroxy-2-naphthoate polyprenyltransferase [Pseudonocardia sp. Ae331_Ps2]OLM04497.1 1,4-dihydroxy-2-naphthoate polyprenyltransferase [Pseudonocardia sp. Ae406_Ps2]OLM10669.1 1,4-dihydroxy-2-naphthoate polyprenyltransferase [Pseudonocardia sp. Ae505_Ps2]OLM26060.1 1,4-dihydroxy-2-naphthoate polyprenyltransferase [Pseudonocardia sp. Ae706_Ps2]OLM33816.1 1,4-dihydroxy-2-naphthoate polyp
MATTAEWVEGARPRTLPTAISPVLVGTGAALGAGAVAPGSALLALLVAVALVIGVNFANDYSDGIRGTDDERVGPQRLVGSRAADPATVKTAAFACFGIAAVAGLVLTAVSGQWWLLLVGALCIVGAWYYTGGSRPYGYAGLGEVAVFVFFGPVAVLGTMVTQAGRVDAAAVGAAVGAGLLTCAVLVANNLRDIPGDRVVGKRTLAVRLGDRGTRMLYLALVLVPFVVAVGAAFDRPGVLLALLALPAAVRPVRIVLGGAQGPALIPVLKDTGLLLLAWGVAVAVGLAFG